MRDLRDDVELSGLSGGGGHAGSGFAATTGVQTPIDGGIDRVG